MAGKGRALSLTPWWCFPCSLGCEESFSLPLSCLGEVRQSWSCWQVVSVRLSRVLCHQLRANLWKHQLVSAEIPILYLILKEISVRLIFRKSFPMLEVWDVAQGLLKVPAPAMASSGSSAAGTWPDPAALGYKLAGKNKIEPSDCTMRC